MESRTVIEWLSWAATRARNTSFRFGSGIFLADIRGKLLPNEITTPPWGGRRNNHQWGGRTAREMVAPRDTVREEPAGQPLAGTCTENGRCLSNITIRGVTRRFPRKTGKLRGFSRRPLRKAVLMSRPCLAALFLACTPLLADPPKDLE